MYLTIDEVNEFIDEKIGNKYLVHDSIDDENKEVLINALNFGMEFKNESKTINSGKEGKYKKYFMELKFNSDDNLPLNEILKFHMLTIVVRSVYEKDGKFYPQIFWMRVCMSYKC